MRTLDKILIIPCIGFAVVVGMLIAAMSESIPKHRNQRIELRLVEDIWAVKDAPTPDDAPPSPIRVGPYLYAIHWRTPEQMGDRWGVTSFEHQAILLDVDIARRPAFVRGTTMHEIMHAALANAEHPMTSSSPYADKFTEEDFVLRIAPIMLEVVRDNPKLIQWFQR